MALRRFSQLLGDLADEDRDAYILGQSIVIEQQAMRHPVRAGRGLLLCSAHFVHHSYHFLLNGRNPGIPCFLRGRIRPRGYTAICT
jgi:hypothetical protein